MNMNFKGIGKLVIYGNGKKLLEKERDFMKAGKVMDDGKISDAYGSEIIGFDISEPKNARKENLNRKDNYFLKYSPDYCKWEKRTALYVHVSEMDVKNLGEFVALEHDGEKDYLYGYKVTFKNGFTARVLRRETFNVPNDWTIPEEEKARGAHWYGYLGDHNNSYQVVTPEDIERRGRFAKKRGKDFKPYNLVHWFYEDVQMTETYYTSEGYHKIEKDTERSKRERIAAAFNGVLGGAAHISHYDIERILKVADITLKEVVPE